MAKNTLVENIKTNDVFEYINFFDQTYRYNMYPWQALCKKTGIKRLEDYNYNYYSSQIILVTRTFQNFVYSKNEEDFKYESTILQSYAEELITDLINNLSIKPKLIVTNFSICPNSLNLHLHALLIFDRKIRKAELIKNGPSLGYELFRIDDFSIKNAVKHAKRDDHEKVLFITVRKIEDDYLTNFVDNVYFSDLIPKIKEIVNLDN